MSNAFFWGQVLRIWAVAVVALFVSACDSQETSESTAPEEPLVTGPQFAGARFDTSSEQAFQDSYFEVIKDLDPEKDEVGNLKYTFGQLASQESYARILASDKIVEPLLGEDKSLDKIIRNIGSRVNGQETMWLSDALALTESLDGLTQVAITFGDDDLHDKTVNEFYLHLAQLYIDNNAKMIEILQAEYDGLEREFLFLNDGRTEMDTSFIDDTPQHDLIHITDASYRWGEHILTGAAELVLNFKILNESRVDINWVFGKVKLYAPNSGDLLVEADFDRLLYETLNAGDSRTVEFVPDNFSDWAGEQFQRSDLGIEIEFENAYMPNGSRLHEGEAWVYRPPPPEDETPLQSVVRRRVELQQRMESLKEDTLGRYERREELLAEQIQPES